MSGINGDKARFHRERKQKIARRERTRKLMNGLAKPSDPASGRANQNTKEPA